MSYSIFLIIFLGVPLFIGLLMFRHRLDCSLVLTLGAVSVVALVYTGPWDNLIVVNGVWTYGPRQVLGIIIGHVPIEEYVFYVLQVCLTGIVTSALISRRKS